jgi:5-methylthioadenosine/S-adenosylhomocysteine deaminase
MKTKKLIENGIVVTVNDKNDVFQTGYVLIDGDRIADIGSGAPPDEIRLDGVEMINAAGYVVMPGLTNAHVHLQQTLIRGLSEDRSLSPWFREIAEPAYMHMTEAEILPATLVGIVENIRGGATSVTDNMTVRVTPGAFEASLQAGKESGIRYKLARGINERNTPEKLVEDQGTILDHMRHLVETWHNTSNGRIRVDFNPHVIHRMTDDTLLKIHELALEWGVGIHLHISESMENVGPWIEKNGDRPVEHLANLGILGPWFQLAHSVWLDDHEIELIAESGACVVHNPVSNMAIGSGIAPIVKLNAAGATVALGTDGQCVSSGQEMIDVLKWATHLAKVANVDAMALSSKKAIQMGCRGGAAAFGMPSEIGSLEVDKKADLILVSLDSSRLSLPSLSINSLLVDCARSEDVDTVIVDGEILMRGKKIEFLDEDALLNEFRDVRAALLKRAGINVNIS